MPMIAITTSNSINVKPRDFMGPFLLFVKLGELLAQRPPEMI